MKSYLILFLVFTFCNSTLEVEVSTPYTGAKVISIISSATGVLKLET